MKNNSKPVSISVRYIVLCSLFILFSVFVFFISRKAFEYRTDKKDYSNSFLLKTNETIDQTIHPDSAIINGISIRFNPEYHVDEGKIIVWLCEDDNVIRSAFIDASNITDDNYLDAYFNTPVYSNDSHKYSIRLSFESNNTESCISVCSSDSGNELSASSIYLADQTLCYQLIMINNSYRFASFITVVLILLLLMLHYIKTIGIEKINLRKAFIFALISILVFEVASIDIFQNARIDFPTEINLDPTDEKTIAPGESMYSDFSVTYSEADRLCFFVSEGSFDSISLTLKDIDNNIVLIDRPVNEDEIIQKSANDNIAVLIQANSCGLKEFPLGNYSIKLTNNSTSIPLSVKGSKDHSGIGMLIEESSWINHWIAFISTLVLIVYSYVIIWSSRKKVMNAENFFLCSVIPLGIIYFILMQPWSVPDTTAHFHASYRLSNLLLGFSDNNGWVMRSCDNSFYNSVWSVAPSYPDSTSCWGYFNNFVRDGKLFETGNNMVDFPNAMKLMEFYSILCYLPEVIGFVFARLLHLGSIPMLMMGRLFMFIFYTTICYRAIKNAPAGKMVFTAVALLPMSLMMSNSISYDAMVIVCSLAFISSLLRLCQDANKKTIIEASVWAFFTGGVKGGAYLILIILLIRLFDKKSDNMRSIKVATPIILSGLLSYAAFNILIPKVVLYQFGVKGIGKLYASWGIEHPIQYINMCARAFLDYADSLTINMAGSNLAWNENTIASIIIVGLLVITGIASACEKDEISFSHKDRSIFLTVILILVCFTPLMLLSYTDVNSIRIEGLQGRYFLPVLPLIYLVLTKYTLKNTIHPISSDNHQVIISKCQRWFAVFSILSVYFIMRLYLTR